MSRPNPDVVALATGLMSETLHGKPPMESTMKLASEVVRLDEAYKPRVPVGVALLLVNKDGHILLHKRKGSHGAGTWSFPGGAVDQGEGPFEAVYRELQEEAGIEQPKGGLGRIALFEDRPWVNSIHEGVDAGVQWITLYFIAAHDGQEPRVMEPEKNDGWKWWPLTAKGFPPDEELFLPLRQIRGLLLSIQQSIYFATYRQRAIDLARG